MIGCYWLALQGMETVGEQKGACGGGLRSVGGFSAETKQTTTCH